MKKLAALVVLLLVAVSVAAYAEEVVSPSVIETVATEEVAAKKYFCPMDGFEADQAGKCEKCGMDLIEKPTLSEEAVAASTETAQTA